MGSLKVMQINIRSIMSKKDILEHYLESKHVDIALICETWLKDNNIRFKHYNILTCNRIDGYGGVAIIIRKNIAYHNITQVDYMPIESIQTTIYYEDLKLKLISLYVNPNMKNSDLKLTFSKMLEDNKHEKFVIIGGDINCHNELWENDSSNDRKGNSTAEILTESDKFCVLNDGTHTYYNLSRCYTSAIDVTIASKELSQLTRWSVDENLSSDHLAIITDITLPKRRGQVVQLRKVHNLQETLKAMEATQMDTFTNYEQMESHFIKNIEENTKIIKITDKFRPKPWWNEEINRLWKVKNYKLKLFNEFKTPYTAIELRKINNKLKNTIRKHKRISWENYLSKINPNTTSKNIWNKINKLRQVQSENHGFFDNPVSITNFLDYNFPNREIKSPVFRKTRGSPGNIFTASNLNKIIAKKKSKSPGTDGISYEMLKKLPVRYIESMADHFNNMWKSQSIPKNWKTTRVVPIPKPNKNQLTVEGYRPISLLPVPLKCFNSVIKERLEYHFESILPPTSLGFRKGKGTQDVIFQLNSQIMKNKREEKTGHDQC